MMKQPRDCPTDCKLCDDGTTEEPCPDLVISLFERLAEEVKETPPKGENDAKDNRLIYSLLGSKTKRRNNRIICNDLW